MLIGRHDIEKLMRFDPSSAYLPNSVGESNMVNSASDAESLEIESELNELLFNLQPIKQVCVIISASCIFYYRDLFLSLLLSQSIALS
jgi:hypothetical protein